MVACLAALPPAQIHTIDAGVSSPTLPSVRLYADWRKRARGEELQLDTRFVSSPNARVETALVAPWIHRRGRFAGPGGDLQSKRSGLGDLQLNGKWALLRDDRGFTALADDGGLRSSLSLGLQCNYSSSPRFEAAVRSLVVCRRSSDEKSVFLGVARKALRRTHIRRYVEVAATPRAAFRGADFPCELLRQTTSHPCAKPFARLAFGPVRYSSRRAAARN